MKRTKQSEVERGEVQNREGEERVFVGKVYRVVSDEKRRTGVKA